MRRLNLAVVGIAAAAIVAVAAQDSNTTCATGLYILCARGSGEPTYSDKGVYPNNTGSSGYLALQVAKQVEGSAIAGVVYPATDPAATGSVNLTAYAASEAAGAQAILEELNQYHAQCRAAKIALMGYSQGAQVIRDTLCGGLGGKYQQ